MPKQSGRHIRITPTYVGRITTDCAMSNMA